MLQGNTMVVINDCGEINRLVTQDIMPEAERERGCVASRDEAFVGSFWVMHVDTSEYEHFLGEAEVVSVIPGRTSPTSSPVPHIQGVVVLGDFAESLKGTPKIVSIF